MTEDSPDLSPFKCLKSFAISKSLHHDVMVVGGARPVKYFSAYSRLGVCTTDNVVKARVIINEGFRHMEP